jgi:hypothetical protein
MRYLRPRIRVLLLLVALAALAWAGFTCVVVGLVAEDHRGPRI